MTDRLDELRSAITATALIRLTNNQVGEQTRLFLLGLPLHAQRQRVRGTTGYTPLPPSKKSAKGLENEKGKAKSEAKSAGCCFVRDAGYGLILFFEAS